MNFRGKLATYFTVSVLGVALNFLLWRYRDHLYNLNTDYEREPWHQIQVILFRGTLIWMAAGAFLLLLFALLKKK